MIPRVENRCLDEVETRNVARMHVTLRSRYLFDDFYNFTVNEERGINKLIMRREKNS